MPELTNEQKQLLAKALAEKEKEKIASILGFAARARCLSCGADRVCDEIRRHGNAQEDLPGKKAFGIVILASDASGNTKKRIRNACNYYQVELYECDLTAAVLGEKIGMTSVCAVCATFDRSFTNGVKKAIAASY